MKHCAIALRPGDGIGREVVPEGVKIIQAAADVLGGFQMGVMDCDVVGNSQQSTVCRGVEDSGAPS